ncbi:MAG: aminotransferase class I/II-fold pyridoxal phosphate-dependent enzyme [Flavobacteriales bacterium]|nr:aminotransferase class I/II-fold pyridoxal phosphate-dependent enzyme [Flavobacteriales bacterium]
MSMQTFIDLRSDTVTKPSPEMLEAMLSAPLGDDVFMEDPTVIELESKLASMFGKEAGLFCPSGTMTNQIAIRMHTVPGQEVICHKESHVYKYEGGGIMVNSLCSVKLIDGNRGRITVDDVKNSLNNPEDVHLPVSRLVSVEDTANRGGGAIYDFEELKRISAFCKEKGLAYHLDGARIFNSLVETGVDYTTYGQQFDSISVCLSKGLGTPVGSVLIGTSAQIKAARRIRKVLGGGMRQAGVLAAAGLFALEHNIQRLKDDHRRAKLIGEMVKKISFAEEVFPVETNIVVFGIKPALSVEKIVSDLKSKGVLCVPFGPGLIRMVTHLDFKEEDLNKLSEVLKSL